MARGKKLPNLKIPHTAGSKQTSFTSAREDAYNSLFNFWEIVAALRGDEGPNRVKYLLLADQLDRQLNGEKFEKVFGINRKALRGRANPRRDWYLLLDYRWTIKTGVDAPAARAAVANDWKVNEETVRKLDDDAGGFVDAHIERMLAAHEDRPIREIAEARLIVVAEERQRIFAGARKSGKRKTRVRKRTRR